MENRKLKLKKIKKMKENCRKLRKWKNCRKL